MTAETDLLDALANVRCEIDRFAEAVVTNTATSEDAARMEQLFADFAGVIRVTLGTQLHRDAMGQS